MERLHIGVRNLFIIGQSHQIVGGHAVKIRQRRNRKWADVLVVIGFVFPQRRFRQAGLLRQLFQRQVLVHHPQVFEPHPGIVSFAYIQRPPLSLWIFQ